MSKILILILYISLSFEFKGPLDYSNQNNWPGDCTTGHSQSPINIPDSFDIEYDSEYSNQRFVFEEINYTPIESTAITYEHEYSISTPSLNNGVIKVKINGTEYTYSLVNVHFHLNAEHTINGTLYPMEMHIVHENVNKNDTLNLHLVLGYIFKIGVLENAFLEKIGLGTGGNVSNVVLQDIVQKEPVYYYKGGLTTPLCTEDVNWVVVKDIKHMSKTQFDKFKSYVESVNKNYAVTGNNRRIHPANGRKVYISNSAFIQTSFFLILLGFLFI